MKISKTPARTITKASNIKVGEVVEYCNNYYIKESHEHYVGLSTGTGLNIPSSFEVILKPNATLLPEGE